MNDTRDPGGRPRNPAHEQEELRAIASLLRNLPDPIPPDTLVPRVLERVAAREARPAILRLASRAASELADRRSGLALAAGVACLLALASLGPDAGPSLLSLGSEPGIAVEARERVPERVQPTMGRVAGAIPSRRRVVVANPQFVSLFNSFPQAPAPRIRLDRERSEVFERVDRGLDQQLNRLLLDPTAYCERLANIPQREAIMVRLADRAADRGDAIEVALRVRQARHPLGRRLADRFMRTAMEQRISPR